MSLRVTRITTKGQAVIPKDLRDITGLGIGDSVSLAPEDDNVRVTRRASWARATAGLLPSSLPPIEPHMLEEMIARATDEEIYEKYGIKP
jgi:bifunctional DNA-binding transcriptional regulator/antitoxin component of YhaV-PrlF toxin-antitoxin module